MVARTTTLNGSDTGLSGPEECYMADYPLRALLGSEPEHNDT